MKYLDIYSGDKGHQNNSTKVLIGQDAGLLSIRNMHWCRYANGKYPTHIIRTKMQKTMHKYGAVFREEEYLKEGYENMLEIYAMFKELKTFDRNLTFNTDLVEAWELNNLLLNCAQGMYAAKERRESRGAHSRHDFPERLDEYDYSKPLEGQRRRSFDQHLRKHTLSRINLQTGEVQITYRPVVDCTLDEDECPSVPPAPRKY